MKETREKIEHLICNTNIELCCSHKTLCLPIIDRIYRKMSVGIGFSGIKVVNDVICDGHHRYLASLLSGTPIDRFPAVRTSALISIDWKCVVFVNNDWDSQDRIDQLNKQDADYNKITLEELLQLLNNV